MNLPLQVLLVGTQVDLALEAIASNAAVIAGAQARSVDAASTDCDPAALVGILQPGERRVPPALAAAAEERWPSAPVILLASEPLAEREMRLAGGRLILLGPPHDPQRLAALLRPKPAAPPAAASGMRRGRCTGWTVGDHDSARLGEPGWGLCAAVGDPGDLAVAEIALAPALAACPDLATAEAAWPPSRRGPVRWAMALLVADGTRWALAGDPTRIRLLSSRRIPAVWSPPGGPDAAALAVLPAEPGDVVVIGDAAASEPGPGATLAAALAGPAVVLEVAP